VSFLKITLNTNVKIGIRVKESWLKSKKCISFFFHTWDFILLRISTQTFQFVHNFSYTYWKPKATFCFFFKQLFQWHARFKLAGIFSLKTSHTSIFKCWSSAT
jgi:hypothetical protein